MSKDKPQPQESEEVDIGQLFKLIGNAFDRLFKFIASIFIGVYKMVLLLLIHFYKKVVWYAAAVIIGAAVGFILDMNSDRLYGANMFIETNFNSARQVYENIKQFHQLANVDKDSLELAKRLNISVGEAAKLKGFYVMQDIDENSIAEMYSSFYTKLDSVSRLEMTFDRYKQSLTPYNFKIHQIGVASTDKTIYKKIENAFVSQISSNDYLESLLTVNRENLERQDKTLAVQIQKTDSLVNEYLKTKSSLYLQKKRSIFIADIHEMPTLITNMFALPKLQKYKHLIYLHYSNKFQAVVPNKKEKVTLLHIKDGKIQNISYISTKKELQEAIEK